MGDSFKLNLVLVALIVLIVLPFASASGIFYVSANDSWTPGVVSSEFAAVNFDGKTEKLAVAITTEPSTNGFWIIPIPSRNLSAAGLNSFPEFQGFIEKDNAMSSLFSMYEWLFAAQIYPLPYLSAVSPRFSLDNNTVSDAAPAPVVDKVEAMAVKTEIISGDKLEEYLSFRKINLLAGMPELKEYAAQNYSFVLSWVRGTNSSITRAMSITFLTEKPHYPMKLARFYNYYHPFVLYSIGNYYPELGRLNESALSTRYQSAKSSPKTTDFFFKEQGGKSFVYNKILIEAIGGNSEEDLQFDKVISKDSVFFKSIAKHPILWGLLVYTLLSCIASMIAAAIIFRDEEAHILAFFVFGFANLLTLIGFWLLAYFRNVLENYTEHENTLNQRMELTTSQRTALAIPIILLIIIVLFIPISLMLELGSIFLPMFMSNLFVFYFVPALIFLILVLWGVFNEKKILYFNLTFTGIFLALLIISFFTFTFFF